MMPASLNLRPGQHPPWSCPIRQCERSGKRNTHRRIAALERALPLAPSPDEADGETIRLALQLRCERRLKLSCVGWRRWR